MKETTKPTPARITSADRAPAAKVPSRRDADRREQYPISRTSDASRAEHAWALVPDFLLSWTDKQLVGVLSVKRSSGLESAGRL